MLSNEYMIYLLFCSQEVNKQKKFRDEINPMSLKSIEKTRDEILRLNQVVLNSQDFEYCY